MSKDLQHIGLVAEVELVARVDAYAERMRVAHPGMRPTRSDAIRELLTLGLRQVEGEGGAPAGDSNG